MKRDIETTLRTLIRAEYLPKDGGAGPEDAENLFESGVLDSAGLVSFIGVIGQEFHLSIPDEDLLPENFLSIMAMASYIRSRQEVHAATALAVSEDAAG